jgi:hypothetical protein
LIRGKAIDSGSGQPCRFLSLLAATSKPLGVGVLVWLAVTGLAGWLGLVRDFQRLPPPMFVLLLAAVVLTVVTAMSRVGSRLVAEAGIVWLIGLQAFRIAVEVFLDWCHRVNLVPLQMTFEGRNWDIVSGVSAVGLAWLAAKGLAPRWLILLWNCVGLALLPKYCGDRDPVHADSVAPFSQRARE